MSDNSTNPLEGLPAPDKAAKPSPLKSDPGHQPQQGERWWLQNSLKPGEETPEEADIPIGKGSKLDVSEDDTDDANLAPVELTTNAESPSETAEEDEVAPEGVNASSKLPFIVGMLVVIGLVLAVMFIGGES